MPNTLLTSQVITNELLRRFKNNLGFAGAVAHTWDDKFAVTGAKIGYTLRLRDPVMFAAQLGPVLVPQNVVETQKMLTLTTQAVVGFSFSSADLTLSIDNFAARYLDSAAVALANRVDLDGLTMAVQSTGNMVGTPGTPITTLAPFWEAGEVLDSNSCPMDGRRTIVYPPKVNTAALMAAQGLFQSSSQIARQYERGRMGIMGGFEWVMDQNCRSFVSGAPSASDTVTTAGQSGSSLAVGTGVYSAGDIITIAGVFRVNRVSGDPQQDLQQFVVTANTTASPIPIYPPIQMTMPGATVSAMPAAGAAITVVTNSATPSPQGVAFHEDAFTIGMAPLEVPKNVQFGANQQDPDTGCAIRMVSMYDIINDLFVTRCDVLYGWVSTRPEWACRIAS